MRPPDAATAKATADPFAGTPYEASPDGWWTKHGGALDVESGVVYLPTGPGLPPCLVPECRCYPTRATDRRKRPAAAVPRPVGAPSRPGEPVGWRSSEDR